MKNLGLLLLFFLVACSSSHVVKPSVPKFAPKGYKAKGLIKYLNNGADSVINRRREDAFKKMFQACKGEYEILGEGNQKEGSVAQEMGDMFVISDTQYWYISYQCVEANQK